MRRLAVLACLCAFAAAPTSAQDSVVEIGEEALNRIARQLGDPSEGGIYLPTATGETACEPFGQLDCPQPPPAQANVPAAAGTAQPILLARCRRGDGWTIVPSGAPVPWQWWVTEARFHAYAGRLEFSAKVHSRVGDKWDVSERTVPATIDFDAPGHRLRIRVQEFKVPLAVEFVGAGERITEVDVGRLYAMGLALEPQRLQVPTPYWPRSVTARVTGATPQFEAGLIRVNLTLGFQ